MEYLKGYYQTYQLGNLIFPSCAWLLSVQRRRSAAFHSDVLDVRSRIEAAAREDGEDAEAERKRPRWKEGGRRAAMERPWKGWRKERSDLQE